MILRPARIKTVHIKPKHNVKMLPFGMDRVHCAKWVEQTAWVVFIPRWQWCNYFIVNY